MGNNLLHKQPDWKIDTGEELSANGSTHIFLIKVDEQYPKIASSSFLSATERKKALRFFKPQDRESYISAKHYLRVILSRFLKIAPEELMYQYTSSKKPYLPGIHFNLSHAKNQIIIAVSEYPIGIDVEYLDPSFTFAEVLEACFDPSEITFISSGNDQRLNFYTLWTRKEAILKATGEGLIDHLSTVPAISLQVIRDHQSYAIESFQSEGPYLISLAIKTTDTVKVEYWKYE